MHGSFRAGPDPISVLTHALPGGQRCHFTANELSHGQIASNGRLQNLSLGLSGTKALPLCLRRKDIIKTKESP